MIQDAPKKTYFGYGKPAMVNYCTRGILKVICFSKIQRSRKMLRVLVALYTSKVVATQLFEIAPSLTT